MRRCDVGKIVVDFEARSSQCAYSGGVLTFSTCPTHTRDAPIPQPLLCHHHSPHGALSEAALVPLPHEPLPPTIHRLARPSTLPPPLVESADLLQRLCEHRSSRRRPSSVAQQRQDKYLPPVLGVYVRLDAHAHALLLASWPLRRLKNAATVPKDLLHGLTLPPCCSGCRPSPHLPGSSIPCQTLPSSIPRLSYPLSGPTPAVLTIRNYPTAPVRASMFAQAQLSASRPVRHPNNDAMAPALAYQPPMCCSPPVRPLDVRKRHHGACGSWTLTWALFPIPSSLYDPIPPL